MKKPSFGLDTELRGTVEEFPVPGMSMEDINKVYEGIKALMTTWATWKTDPSQVIVYPAEITFVIEPDEWDDWVVGPEKPE